MVWESFDKVSLFFRDFMLVAGYVYDRSIPGTIPFLATGLLFFSAIFNFLLTFPVIFKYYLTPKIEKKAGKKIEWPKFINSFIAGKFIMPSGLVAQDIMKLYFLFKFKGYKGTVPYGVLKDIGYTIDMVSKSELRMSILFYVNILAWIFSAVLAYIIKIKYHMVFN